MPGAWLFYVYIKLCACMDAMCKECLWKKIAFVQKKIISHEKNIPAFHK